MKILRKLSFVIACVMFCCLTLSVALAEQSPREKVQTTVEQCKTLVSTKKQALSREQLDQEMRKLLSPVFDFREMAKRCLGSNWNEGNPDQQKEFVDLFSELLAKTYLKKVIDNIEESKIVFPEEKVEGDKALVKTTIVSSGEQILVDYRLFSKDGVWLVYDVIIENVGLVSNYRTEFAGIIRKEGFDGLLIRLREKKEAKSDN